MKSRTFYLLPGKIVAAPCPSCGNTIRFIGRSQQVMEDLCEVWIECKCGHDPTQGNSGDRMESVWGSLDKQTLGIALDGTWNRMIEVPASAIVEAGDSPVRNEVKDGTLAERDPHSDAGDAQEQK